MRRQGITKIITIHPMPVPNFMAIHPIVVEIFRLKPQMSHGGTRGITKVMTFYCLGTKNVCSTFCGSPYSRCGDIFLEKSPSKSY